jgi:GT2 family glycosyltransferase
MIDVSVVIVSFNTRELTIKCLKSVFEQNHVAYEVIVVDNASSDNSAKEIKKTFPQVSVIENNVNTGFAHANNQAIKQANGRYILLLNSDTVLLSDDTFNKMVVFMDAKPQAGISSCKITKPGGSLDYPCKRSFQTPAVFFYRSLKLDKVFPYHQKFGKYHLTYLDENQIHEVDAISGAFFMIRRETLDDIGLLDEKLFMYSEDMDWCLRAKQNHWKVYYYPGVQIIHYKSSSNNQRSPRMMYWWYYSTWYVYKKHTAKNYNFIVNFIIFFGFCTMFAISLLRNSLVKSNELPSRK